MPLHYTVEGPLIHLRWSGTVSYQDLREAEELLPRLGRQIAEQGGGAPRILQDFSAVVDCAFSPQAAIEVSQHRRQIEIPLPVRSASVAPTPETRGMARAFQAFNRNANLQIEVFATAAAARAWLDAAG